MRVRFALLAAVAAVVVVGGVFAASEDRPYLGTWSNGRGETLVVTERTIRFGDDRAVPYRDVTRATDGSAFELQITAHGEVNAFPGKTLGVEVEQDTMKIRSYASHAAYMHGDDPQSEVTWYRDDAADSDEE